MKKNYIDIFMILIIFLYLLFSPIITLAQTSIVEAFPNLTFSKPVDIQNAGDSSNRIFVVEQAGRILVFQNNENESKSTVFLDIKNLVNDSGNEEGLLGLAFHPNFNSNGYFFVNYTASDPRRTVITRFSVSINDSNFADVDSKLVILEVEQPYSNHNGGQLAFGSDGFLYISFGDGGSAGDPKNNGQNLATILASIIRIDIDNANESRNYSIPQDNPFVNNTEGYKEEIFAYGLRNVWRFSFDPIGNIWAADVGQNEWEEINLIESGSNYGWRIMEGLHCYEPSSDCNREGLKLPIWEYGHNSNGGYSITGGYVSQDPNVPDIFNKYIYADYISGNIWAFDLRSSSMPNSLIKKVSRNISTFGVDENKRLYFADLSSGKLYKFIDNSVNSVGSVTPTEFELHQNFPNPFNPSTIIKYAIPELETSDLRSLHSNFVQLKVYDSMGKEVTTLVNQKQYPGNYYVNFEASSFASGIYFYELIANRFVVTKKMILQK